MGTTRKTVQNVQLYIMKDDNTGHTQVNAGSGMMRKYLGELFPQCVDDLHLHLCEMSPGIEVWEPDRPWPWKTHHATVQTEYQGLVWLIDRAVKRGDL